MLTVIYSTFRLQVDEQTFDKRWPDVIYCAKAAGGPAEDHGNLRGLIAAEPILVGVEAALLRLLQRQERAQALQRALPPAAGAAGLILRPASPPPGSARQLRACLLVQLNTGMAGRC